MLKFEVQNQIIKRMDAFTPVAGSRNYLKAEFIMTGEWQGNVTAVFGYDGSFYRVILDGDNSCIVPWEVIKPPLFTVSLFCGTESLVTANVVMVAVEGSGMNEGAEPSEPTPEVWQQYMQRMQRNIENAVPYIGENGNWYVYNTELGEHENSGILAAPEKGVDYWTEEDKAEIKEDVAPFIVNITGDDIETGTADKTIAEISAAYNEGKTVIAKHGVYILPLISVLNGSEAIFLKTNYNGAHIMYDVYDGGVAVMAYDFATKTYVDEQIGDIETALDGIIAIQNQLMGVSE